MAIPSRNEAVEEARVNAEIDAAKIMRKVEAALMTWDGESTVKVEISAHDKVLADYVVKEYRAAGWASWQFSIKKRTNGDYWIVIT